VTSSPRTLRERLEPNKEKQYSGGSEDVHAACIIDRGNGCAVVGELPGKKINQPSRRQVASIR